MRSHQLDPGGTRPAVAGNPFDPADEAAYESWRAWKLSTAAAGTIELFVTIAELADPKAGEIEAIAAACLKSNMAFYACPNAPQGAALEAALHRFSGALGLRRPDPHLCGNDDGLTALQVAEGGRRGGYIPYSNRPLGWHTDGYYNQAQGQIRAVLLHCAADAAEGGENALLDPDIAYIRLRDADPALVTALMHPDAMTVPANVEDGVEIRPARSGPVFSVDASSGALHMRFTSRPRHIVWRNDIATRDAVGFIARLLKGGDPLMLRRRLAPGEGIIGNNVLHNRTEFHDETARGRKRLLYRARYLNRVGGPGLCQAPWAEDENA